jgi:hypothetical protein
MKMPKRRTHEKIAKLLLGKSYPNVDIVIDLPSKFLGSSHRRIFHTPLEAALIGLFLSGDIRGAADGVLHILVDAVESSVNRELLKLTETGGIRKYQKKRKQKRRKKNQQPT